MHSTASVCVVVAVTGCIADEIEDHAKVPTRFPRLISEMTSSRLDSASLRTSLTAPPSAGVRSSTRAAAVGTGERSGELEAGTATAVLKNSSEDRRSNRVFITSDKWMNILGTSRKHNCS